MADQESGRPRSEWHVGVRHFFFNVIDNHPVEIAEQSFIVDKVGQLEVKIHIGLVNDRLACIGVDIRSFGADLKRPTVKGAVETYHPFDQRGGFTDSSGCSFEFSGKKFHRLRCGDQEEARRLYLRLAGCGRDHSLANGVA